VKKVAVSACLLGEFCRYDGATKKDNAVVEALKGCEIIPFCPEAPALGTPRGRISVIEEAGAFRLIADESGKDVTGLIIAQTQQLIDGHPDLDRIILKSKSPSCGIGTTPILNSERKALRLDDGIAAAMLKKHYNTIEISDEKPFSESKE